MPPQAAAPAEPEQTVPMSSTYREDFLSKDLPAREAMGSRVMRGVPDMDWRKEMGITARHRVRYASMQVCGM